MAISSVPLSTPAATTAISAAQSSTERTALQTLQANSGTPVTQATSAQQPAAEADSEQLQQAMDKIRDSIPPVARNLRFSVDEDTGRTVVKVVDPSTDEVIRQIPSEEVLAIAKDLENFSAGLLLKDQA